MDQRGKPFTKYNNESKYVQTKIMSWNGAMYMGYLLAGQVFGVRLGCIRS